MKSTKKYLTTSIIIIVIIIIISIYTKHDFMIPFATQLLLQTENEPKKKKRNGRELCKSVW